MLFVLDAGTVLESDTYIERTVQELFQAVGIASAWGSIRPLREQDRRAADESTEIRAFVEIAPYYRPSKAEGWLRRLAFGVMNVSGEVFYLFVERFVLRGQMAAFGTALNPAGCAVAYRRSYLEAFFDTVKPQLDDDLANAEDIFIGLAMLDEGYRNVQVLDVCARTAEPELQRLPKQLYRWSSAFLQSVLYFDTLVRSPFKVLNRRHIGRGATDASTRRIQATTMRDVVSGPWAPAVGERFPTPGPAQTDRRRIQEPYRQAFGRAHTRTYGRPAGWALLASAVERIGFPTVLLLMVILGHWEWLAITVAVESLIMVTALMLVMKGQRLEYFLKGVAVTPVRYVLLAVEVAAIARFASDVWVTGKRKARPRRLAGAA